jgi:hypothetical protein
MWRSLGVLLALALLLTPGASHPATAAAATPVEVFGAWHCGNDECTWGSVRDMADFDANNHWLVDRGNGSPSVNLVVLSFVDPLKLLQRTNDQQTANGVPVGMTPAIVRYFTGHGVRVMLAIGGITFVSDWDTALATNPTQLGLDAAALATSLGAGIEIDYEQNTSPNLAGLQSFIDAYRSQVAYDATGANPAARLTIDLGAGDRFLIDIARRATTDWLTPSRPVLDYANALVPGKQPTSASAAESNWQEHVSGEPQFAPPIPPLAPAKFTGSLFIAGLSKVEPECTSFATSLERSTGGFVQSVAPAGSGTTPGMLGYMFWAAERPSLRGATTTPPNTCQGGVGAGATAYDISIPMTALRQS